MLKVYACTCASLPTFWLRQFHKILNVDVKLNLMFPRKVYLPDKIRIIYSWSHKKDGIVLVTKYVYLYIVSLYPLTSLQPTNLATMAAVSIHEGILKGEGKAD